ncbi:hypothetical protein K9L27_04250 [Candidatus Gracilibacteria bacterium]|nr:hypothetical protein [Candidatus Gracilibacteria bacterium]
MKKTVSAFGSETLLLSREIFKNRVTQIITSSLLLFFTIGVQVYLFIVFNNLMKIMLLKSLALN